MMILPEIPQKYKIPTAIMGISDKYLSDEEIYRVEYMYLRLYESLIDILQASFDKTP